MNEDKSDQLYAGGKCPVIGVEWEYDERNPDSHFFEDDYDYIEKNFASSHASGKIGFHCTKCGLTIRFKTEQ